MSNITLFIIDRHTLTFILKFKANYKFVSEFILIIIYYIEEFDFIYLRAVNYVVAEEDVGYLHFHNFSRDRHAILQRNYDKPFLLKLSFES